MSRLNLTVSRGSEILYRGDSLPTAMSLISASLTSDRQTLHAIRRFISARALVYGQSRFAAAASPTPAPFGQPVSPASLSPRQAKVMGLLTSGTYGPNSSISSSSAALKLSLASRLRQRTDSLGSTLFNLTWKERGTPSGRSIPALRASVRRTSASECTGWQQSHWITPQTHDVTTRGNTEADHHYSPHDLSNMALLSGWPTPTLPSGGQTPPEGTSATGMTPDGRKVQVTLKDVANLASWATPAARDWRSNDATPEHHAKRLAETRGKPLSEQTHQLASWVSPTSTDASRGGLPARPWDSGVPLTQQVALVSSGPARLTASGQIVTGYSAETVSGDQLNPEHSRWLMACPVQWAQAAPNFDDWQAWQGLMQNLSPEQKNIVLGRSAPTATPSTSNTQPSSAGLR